MTYGALLSMVDNLGYLALFLSLWLGLFSLPVPNELAALLGGALAAGGLLHPAVAFLTLWAGTICGLTFGYGVGRAAEAVVLPRLKSGKLQGPMAFAEKLMATYGRLALAISFFIPVIRHLLPYLNGAGRMRFRSFALYAYSGALVWTAVYFSAGMLAGEHLESLWNLLPDSGLKLLWLPFAIGASFLILKAFRLKRRPGPNSGLWCQKGRGIGK